MSAVGKRKKTIIYIVSVCFWIGVWYAVSYAVGNELLLPMPHTVVIRLFELAVTADYWVDLSLSLLRVVAGIFAGIVFGTLLAILTEKYGFMKIIFSPVLTVIKSTPVASFIILLLIWTGRDILPAIIASLIVLPVIHGNVSAGIASTDKGLLEMAKVFGLGKNRTVIDIYIPSAAPYFYAGCRSSVGMGWKAGIAAEVLAVPAASIGRMLYESKLYLETTDLFAWTQTVIIVSLAVEKTVLLLSRKAAKSSGNGGKVNA